MSTKEAKRLYVVQQVLDRQLRQRRAAELLACSVRQVRRWVWRVRSAGARGLVHQLRGRPSNRRTPDRLRERVVRLYRQSYGDFGPTLFSEKLQERHHLRVNRETLRQWLLVAGLWQRQRHGRSPHVWRERKACAGELVQLDGSHHDWLEHRGPRLVLMAYIDDATSRVFARFYEGEGTHAALASFQGYVQRYGLPQALYADRHTTYRSPRRLTVEEELAGQPRPQSQFERAVSELGVTLIPAYSPQAKGRVERLFRTFQDRLIKELRLAHITTQAAANRFLVTYLPRYNRRFSRVPASRINLHRPAPRHAILRRTLAIRATHPLRLDNTLRHAKSLYLVQAHWPGRRPSRLQVEERLDGKLYVLDGARALRYRPVQERPLASPDPRSTPSGAQRRRIPPPDHPWRRGLGLGAGRDHQRTVLSCEEADISKLR